MSKETALMVIDVQRDVVDNALDIESVVKNINSLISKARLGGSPVIWVQHSDPYLVKGSTGWEIVPELVPQEGDVRIYKTHPSSFEETDLDQQLARLGAKKIVISGAQTDMCVNATSNAAVDYGFDVTLVSDAHTTEDNSQTTAAELIAAKNDQFGHLQRLGQLIEVKPEHLVNF
jgi:nicotinamidase-related amidase